MTGSLPPSGSGAQHQGCHDLEDVGQDQEADDGGQRRGPVALLGEAKGNADGEEQREVLKQGSAGGADHLGDGGQAFEPAQQVVLAERAGGALLREGRRWGA